MWLLLLACSPTPAPPPSLPPSPDFDEVLGVAWREQDVIQATGNGRLIARDRHGLVVVREIAVSSPIVALGDGRTDPLVAMADGTVAHLLGDGLVEFARLPAPALWVGADGAYEWAVYSTGRDEHGRHRVEARRLDLGVGYGVPQADSVFALPAAARVNDGVLWLGWDQGEWGGAISKIEPDGQARDIPFPWAALAGISGFTDDAFAYGGMLHWSGDAYVVRLVGGATGMDPEVVFWSSTFTDPLAEGPPNPAPVPELPLRHVLDEGDERIALTFGQIWRTDRAFGTWTLERTIDLETPSGRPDAMGAYDPVRSAWREPDGTLLLATVGNGIVGVKSDGTEVRPPTARIGQWP